MSHDSSSFPAGLAVVEAAGNVESLRDRSFFIIRHYSCCRVTPASRCLPVGRARNAHPTVAGCHILRTRYTRRLLLRMIGQLQPEPLRNLRTIGVRLARKMDTAEDAELRTGLANLERTEPLVVSFSEEAG